MIALIQNIKYKHRHSNCVLFCQQGIEMQNVRDGRDMYHQRDGDMRGGHMRGGDMRGGDMRGGDMRGGDMRGGPMRGGDMRGGDFRDGSYRDVDRRFSQDSRMSLDNALYNVAATQMSTSMSKMNHNEVRK